MAKYLVSAQRLGERIKRGDYNLNPLPSERSLAEELGISTMTVRKTLQTLIDQGLLERQSSGRLQVSRNEQTYGGSSQIAMLVPAFESPELYNFQIALSRMSAENNYQLRMVYYAHWDDPVIVRTLQEFCGVFFLPLTTQPPEPVLNSITEYRNKLTVIEYDWTEYGIPSLVLFPARSIRLILDHLYEIGCRRIACMNTQPEDHAVKERINQWKLWMKEHSLEQVLVNQPVPPFTPAIDGGYLTAQGFINHHANETDAIYCITQACALGVARAMANSSLIPGRDIALCAVNGEICKYSVPSITTLTEPVPDPLISQCIQAMQKGTFPKKMLVEPLSSAVSMRESTSFWRPQQQM